MKRTFVIPLFLLLILLSGCKKKCDSCGPNQECNNGVCQCQQWYEGSSCETKMIDKFSGTFIGSTYVNSANPKPDTFIFQSFAKPNVMNFTNATMTNGYMQEGYINLLSSTTGDYITFINLPNQTGEISKKNGKATISGNGNDLTITFYYITGSGTIDSNTLYTFIGIKQ